MGLMYKIMAVGGGRQMKRYEKMTAKINAIEPDMKRLSDAELAALTDAFCERYAAGESLDSLLPEAFAAVREASVRTLGLRHFDVQLIGGMALHDGQIAEMLTGEGKTLVSVLAGYLNAIPGHNVHVVTANDYLASRDCEQMGCVYRFLGMSTGLIQNGMQPAERLLAYQADVTYGTNAEFGFDYLRDNMVPRAEERVQRGHHFAIVDEVDSILIDEARTPLIISGSGTCKIDDYRRFARAVRGLKEDDDFQLDEAKRTVVATETGLAKVESLLGIEDIYADISGALANHLEQALTAQFLFRRDVDYVVTGDEVKIVDSFTGRIMEGRRFSDGLHQAIEAKEDVTVREESQTLASVTLQNYFRLYKKLSGMTGTAMTEEAEFRQIYNLGVVSVPPNKPVARIDEEDLVFKTADAKFAAVVKDVVRCHAMGQPCLVGTVSIENSERLSHLLSQRGIKHEVLNAKNHEREAAIVAQAGRLGAVTIATNMAGRGTDILLGGTEASPEEREAVLAAGGLRVIGTERHESRRIDNQLRGRAGRQGDPGSSQFFLSLEDDLLRLFGGSKTDSISKMMEKAGMNESMPVRAPMVSKSVESAQRQVEGVHFAARKNLLEYDDVMNLQRIAMYTERSAILEGKDMRGRIPSIISDAVYAVVAKNCPKYRGSWDTSAIETWAANMTGREDFSVNAIDHGGEPSAVADALIDYLQETYEQKELQIGEAMMGRLASSIMMRVIDMRWMMHLHEMDCLKTGIGLRSIGHRDPLVEYKEEAYDAFERLTSAMYEDFLRIILRFKLTVEVKVIQPAT